MPAKPSPISTSTSVPATPTTFTPTPRSQQHSDESPITATEPPPRLSSPQKKANHIASEQKRRQAIREGFDRLTEIVPGLEGQGRSESVVLKRVVEYMREKGEERRILEGELCVLMMGEAAVAGSGNAFGR